MSAGIDVLEVIDGEISSLPAICEMVRIAGAERGWSVDESEAIERLRKARAALAELIEAVDELSRFSDETAWDDLSDETGAKTAALWTRVEEALDRVRGAA